MKLFKALFFGIILFPSAALADTVICRGGGCPPEATSVGLSTGITKAVAGVGISLNPTSGIGEVTFTSLGGGSVGSAGDSIASATMTRVNGGITNSYQINSDTKAFQTATQFVIKSSLAVESTITSTSGFRGPLDYSFLTNVPATSGGSDNLGAHASSKAVNMSGFPITGVSSITFANGATARISSVTIVGTLTSTSPIIGMISSAAVNTIVVAQHFNAINPGTGKILSMAADNTLAWATDQSAAGGGDQMGAHVATMPVVSAFAATFSSITSNGPISVGGGPAIIDSTQTVLQVRVTDTSDVDFEVAETSVSVGGVRVSTYQVNTVAVLANHSLDATGNGNVISFRDQDRFTTPSFASGTFVTYIATPTMGISSSTIGHFQFHNAISSQANFAVYAWIPPSDIDLTANIILSSFGVILGGADTGTQRYVVAIATSMDGRPATETMFAGPYGWLEGINVDVGANAAGANGYLEVVQNTTLTNWQTRIIPGALHYITVSRDGDAAQDGSTIDSYSSFFSVSYKRRLAQ